MSADLAELYLRGETLQAIAARLSLDLHAVAEAAARLDSVVLLLAASFPPALIARAARLSPAEAEAAVLAVRKGLGTGEALLCFARSLGHDAPAAPGTQRRAGGAELPTTADADEALEALQFWTSKWE